MTGSGKELVPVKRVGAPKGSGSKYTEEIADEIIERLSHGQTLISICRTRSDGEPRAKGEYPDHTTIYDWADPKDRRYRPEFGPRFARAKLDQQRYWIEECHDIADTPLIGVEESHETSFTGVKVRRLRKDMLHHRMLQIDTRLKVLARMNPQLWAERLQQAAPPENGDGQHKLTIEGGLPEDDHAPPPGFVSEAEPEAPDPEADDFD